FVIPVFVLTQSRAGQSDSTEESALPRPGENFRRHRRIGLSLRISTHGSRCNRSLAPERELGRKQAIHTLLIHDQHENIGFRAANLESEATTLHANRARSRPAQPVLLPARHESFAILGANNECTLLEPGDHHGTLSFI